MINLDGQARISYRLEADLINNQSPLNTAEQQALASIYSQCAPCAGRALSCACMRDRKHIGVGWAGT